MSATYLFDDEPRGIDAEEWRAYLRRIESALSKERDGERVRQIADQAEYARKMLVAIEKRFLRRAA